LKIENWKIVELISLLNFSSSALPLFRLTVPSDISLQPIFSHAAGAVIENIKLKIENWKIVELISLLNFSSSALLIFRSAVPSAISLQPVVSHVAGAVIENGQLTKPVLREVHHDSHAEMILLLSPVISRKK